MKRERKGRPTLAIVTPVYNEAENLEAYYTRVTEALRNCGADIEFILVDDGSSDASWRMIEALSQKSPAVHGIRLSRNFGAHVALAAGFDHVPQAADAVATLACDLQDPPEAVLSFLSAWRDGADIVWGSRRERADGSWRRLSSSLMEKLLRRFAMPRGSKFRTGSFLLMDRRVLQCFLKYREQNRVTFALVAWTGFEQAVVEYDRQARTRGTSGWSFGRLLNTAYDVFIGFSPLPAKIVTATGFALFGTSIAILAYLIVAWFFQSVQPGWTGIMATITFFFGILFMMVGMLAEYLYRIFIETKERPLYFVADTAGRTPLDDQGSKA